MAKNSKDEAFKKPTLMKITGRTSSITNAFGNELFLLFNLLMRR